MKREKGGSDFHTRTKGRFDGLAPPGQYTVQVYIGGVRTSANGVLDVRPGQPLVRTVHLHTQQVTLRVVGSDGKRRDGVQLFVGTSGFRCSLDATDADRDLNLRLPFGRVVVWAMPEGVQGGWSAHVRVAEIDVKDSPAAQVVRIVLPDSLGY